MTTQSAPKDNIVSIFFFFLIIFSVVIVLIDSIRGLSPSLRQFLDISEVIVSVLFTIEYVYRIIKAKRKFSYVFSFYGAIDLVSVLPFYLGLFHLEAGSFLIIRAFRIFRIFRIFKLAKFLGEESVLKNTLKRSLPKITVFLVFVLIIIILFGSLMYLIEGEENGFTSIPKSIYWAIVTMTTVGYGDIAPQTVFGQFMASVIMLLGYGIIAVPTGLVIQDLNTEKRSCNFCHYLYNNSQGKFCSNCGKKLKNE